MYQGDGIDEGIDDENVKTRQDKHSCVSVPPLDISLDIYIYIYTRPPNLKPPKVSFSFLLR